MNATQTKWRITHTVAARMARDQARAKRIRDLKDENPDITWQEIADHVGVSHRAAQAWPETGSIASGNARKLAELWGVDYELLYHGPRGTPDLMGALRPDTAQSTLLRLEQKIEQLLKYAAAQAPPDAPGDAPAPADEPEEDEPGEAATA